MSVALFPVIEIKYFDKLESETENNIWYLRVNILGD